MTIVAAPLTVDDVARWLVTPVADTGAGLGEWVYAGPKIPAAGPDRIVLLTWYGGPGAVEENLFEVLAFQARCRGVPRPGVNVRYATGDLPTDATSAYGDAENLAKTVDRAFVDAKVPALMNGRYVRSIVATSAPAYLLTDPGGRVHFTANYLLTAARA